jgi:hypothetical protein
VFLASAIPRSKPYTTPLCLVNRGFRVQPSRTIVKMFAHLWVMRASESGPWDCINRSDVYREDWSKGDADHTLFQPKSLPYR